MKRMRCLVPFDGEFSEDLKVFRYWFQEWSNAAEKVGKLIPVHRPGINYIALRLFSRRKTEDVVKVLSEWEKLGNVARYFSIRDRSSPNQLRVIHDIRWYKDDTHDKTFPHRIAFKKGFNWTAFVEQARRPYLISGQRITFDIESDIMAMWADDGTLYCSEPKDAVLARLLLT